MTASPSVPRRIATLALAAIALTGCGADPGAAASPAAGGTPGTCAIPVGPVAVAVGGRANSPAPAVTPRLAEIFTTAVTAVQPEELGPTLTLVRLDGRSDQVTSGRFTSDAANPEAFAGDRTAFLSSVETAIRGHRAAVPEADDLAALSTAGRAAREPGSPSGTVVLVDSGLSTVAPLDLSAPGALDADVEETVAALARDGGLPDLRGLVVVLIGLGDVAFPSVQDPLDEKRRKHLVELYTRIAQETGASCVEVVPAPRSGPAADSVPSVRPVPVPRPATISTTDPGPTVLPDDPVTGFVPRTATLLDEGAAELVVRPLAEWLRADPARSVRLSGTTARVGPLQGQRDLGLERAEVIKRLLVELGVAASQVSTEGLGSEFPEYVVDHDASGALLPAPAHSNRSVRIVPHPA